MKDPFNSIRTMEVKEEIWFKTKKRRKKKVANQNQEICLRN
jgi:hypothetical protein